MMNREYFEDDWEVISFDDEEIELNNSANEIGINIGMKVSQKHFDGDLYVKQLTEREETGIGTVQREILTIGQIEERVNKYNNYYLKKNDYKNDFYEFVNHAIENGYQINLKGLTKENFKSDVELRNFFEIIYRNYIINK